MQTPYVCKSLMLKLKSHLNTYHISEFSIEGKGYCIVGIRFRGWDLHVTNIYLQSGTGPNGEINNQILEKLGSHLLHYSQAWCVIVDWNCGWEELPATGFIQPIKGNIVGSPEAVTTQSKHCIDYAISKQLAGFINFNVEADVPFRPHSAAHLSLRLEDAHFPFPQPHLFTAGEPVIPEEVYREQELVRAPYMDQDSPKSELDQRWAGFWKQAEVQVYPHQVEGRGWNFPAERKPLIPRVQQEAPWHGGYAAYWSRLQLWIDLRSKGPPEPGARKGIH